MVVDRKQNGIVGAIVGVTTVGVTTSASLKTTNSHTKETLLTQITNISYPSFLLSTSNMAEDEGILYMGFVPPPMGWNERRPGAATVEYQVDLHFPPEIRIPDQRDLDMSAPDVELEQSVIDDEETVDIMRFRRHLYWQQEGHVIWWVMQNVFGVSRATELLFFVALYLLSVTAKQMNVPHMRWSLAVFHKTCRMLALIMYDEDAYGRVWWRFDNQTFQEGYAQVKQIVSGLERKKVNGNWMLVLPA